MLTEEQTCRDQEFTIKISKGTHGKKNNTNDVHTFIRVSLPNLYLSDRD